MNHFSSKRKTCAGLHGFSMVWAADFSDAPEGFLMKKEFIFIMETPDVFTMARPDGFVPCRLFSQQ